MTENIEESDLINDLQHYMRLEFSPDFVLKNKSAVKERLQFKIKDYCLKRGKEYDRYKNLADECISRYLSNWKDKIPGEDDRGHRFGKTYV